MPPSPRPVETAHRSIPADILCAQDYEALAPRFLAAPTHAYIAGGSGRDRAVAANRAAFDDWAVVPRLLRDLTHGHTRLVLGGCAQPHPLWLAPVAFQTLAHPAGERETARAAEAMSCCMIASTLSSCTLEDIAALAGPTKWFQLYLQPRREASLALLRRAEQAGFGTIVVTLDAAIQQPSLQAQRAGFRLPAHCTAANLEPVEAPRTSASDPSHSRVFQGLMRDAPTWADIDWLCGQTALPVWVKGVLDPDDAAALQARGIAGVVVSNHGGRALDAAPASLRALPAIRARVGADYPLLFDGGIRGGDDVFKALALGAGGVLIGRLQVYALAVAGALGVAHMVRLLHEELEACMALAGCATLADIQPGCLMAVSGGARAHAQEISHAAAH